MASAIEESAFSRRPRIEPASWQIRFLTAKAVRNDMVHAIAALLKTAMLTRQFLTV